MLWNKNYNSAISNLSDDLRKTIVCSRFLYYYTIYYTIYYTVYLYYNIYYTKYYTILYILYAILYSIHEYAEWSCGLAVKASFSWAKSSEFESRLDISVEVTSQC